MSTRMVVGWSMASHMRTSLIIDALSMARDHGHLDADVDDAIFHSDRGPIHLGRFPEIVRREWGHPVDGSRRRVLGLSSPNRSSHI